MSPSARAVRKAFFLLAIGSIALSAPAQVAMGGQKVTAQQNGVDEDEATLSVTVTDDTPGSTVSGLWVKVAVTVGVLTTYYNVGPTGADGKATNEKSQMSQASTVTGTITDCPAAKSDVNGSLNFNSSTGFLAYNGATVGKVFYTDMTSTTVNTAVETIIGANVHLIGMHFQGFNAHGFAEFGNATLRVEDGQGLFFQAAYNNIDIMKDPTTGNSILSGRLGNFSFNTSRVSLFDTEFKAGLSLISSPDFYLQSNGDLAALTNQFALPGAGGQNATVNVIFSPTGGGQLDSPEPSSLVLLGAGIAAAAGLFFRRR